MKYDLIIKEPVKTEITEAYNYYEDKQEKLGSCFIRRNRRSIAGTQIKSIRLSD